MAGISLSVVSSATANRGGVPAWIGTPEVRGKNEVDRKLSVRVEPDMYTYTPTLEWMRPTLSWQWKRDGVAIVGATDPVYVTTSSDLAKAITCTVTLTGENGSASVTTGSTFTSYEFSEVSDPSGTIFSNPQTYSNTIGASTITTTYDLVALGVLKSSQTTGSISAASTSLVVASAAGFSTGDKIIVETGGEAGGGLPGSVGVGGVWPALSYANATAMNADTSQADGTCAWLRDTGIVYFYTTVGTTWTQVSADYAYIHRAIPRALLAEITNIAGNTITLDTAASATATNANVYFDNSNKFNPYTVRIQGLGPPDYATIAPKRIYISAGSYAFSSYTGLAQEMKDIVIEGDGSAQTFFVAPDGCSNINFRVSTTQRSIFRKFGIVGNHKLNTWARSGYAETSWYDTFFAHAQAIRFTTCADILVDDVKIYDAENQAINLSVHLDSFIRNCTAGYAAPLRVYNQWSFNVADSAYSGIIDCTVDSDYAMAGVEIFGGANNYILNLSGRNAYLSVNSSTNFYVSGTSQTFEADCAYNYDAGVAGGLQNWSPNNPCINLNTNIANQQGRADPTAIGACLNPSVVIEGMMNGDVSGRNNVIIVAPGYANVMIKGGYIEVPEQQSPSWTALGAACDGDGMTVSGSRFVGFSVAGDKSIDAERSAGCGRVVNCIGENITGKVKQRNMTNAEYTAAGGT